MTTQPAGALTRRDLLAGVGAVLAGSAFVPRVAAALQDATPVAAPDGEIARLAVFPPLGICRVGNSREWFLAPEVPGLPPVPEGRYKNGPDEVLKQAQRFRVYAFDASGAVLREITAGEATVRWTVHVANTKASWYGFANPLDNGAAAPGLPGRRRNDAVVDPRARAANLVVDPGPRTIAGPGVNPGGTDPAHAMTGRFWGSLDVGLGHLRTDDAGRLLVVPGDGVSRSATPNNPITNFADNDGWHDDWCDGPVRATVTFGDGREMAADPAWVACVGPDWAPEIPPIVSLHDVMTEVAIDAGWLPPPPRPVSFRQHVYPTFRKLAMMGWVSSAAHLASGWLGADVPTDSEALRRLVDPSPGNAEFRRQILAMIRDPASDDPQQYALPYMLGDGVNYEGSPLRWLKMPRHQYDALVAWADGDFVPDLDPDAPESVASLDDLPLAAQPEALTRAALEPCSGGAFHPGVELTWPLRHRELFSEPYRIAHATNRNPNLLQDVGLLLTPELAFAGTTDTPPPIGPQAPGDLTRWMGLPWQGDAFSCQQVLFPNDFPVASWWPALLPIDVIPEVYYESLMNPALPAEQRIAFYEGRVLWSRGVAGVGYHAAGSYLDGVTNMIALWTRMGFVVGRPGPDDPDAPDHIPDRLQVEVDRGSIDMRTVPGA